MPVIPFVSHTLDVLESTHASLHIGRERVSLLVQGREVGYAESYARNELDEHVYRWTLNVVGASDARGRFKHLYEATFGLVAYARSLGAIVT